MKKRTLFLIYLLLSSYLNVGFVGVTHVVTAESYVFYDDFNDNTLDTEKWTEDVVGSGNSYTEANGEAQFVTYGHGGDGWNNGRAALVSKAIVISNWSSITLSGKWKFTDPSTAEMFVRILDADSDNFVAVHYVSWDETHQGNEYISYRYPGKSVKEIRTIPRSYVSFKIVLYRDRFEYWESGTLVKTMYTTGMENATRFQIFMGGWDETERYSHMYFDDIAVEYTPEEPAEKELQITIHSPKEQVYHTTTIDLNVTANKEVDEWYYSLNGGENVSFKPNRTIEAEEGENHLVVYATAGDENASARVDFYVELGGDTTPPGTVENLTHEVGTDYIHWTWDNPKDEDFEGALVYIDGKYQGETTDEEWWLDELSAGETHEIGLLTKDTSGNVNTTWVNDTATTLVPAETVYVNESGWWYEGGNFNPSETPLQDGIEAAVENGTVVVLAGTYHESVEIDRPLTVETDEGAEVRGDGSYWDDGMKPVFYVESNNVTLRGFTINSSVSNVGVWITDAQNCTVEGNTIIITEGDEDVRYGVYLSYGGNNTVRNNEVSVSGFQGIGIYVYEESEESTVSGNTVTVNGDGASGIEVFESPSIVHDNDVRVSGVGENPGYALYLYTAGDSDVYDNTFGTNLSEPRAWAINVVDEFTGSLSSNRINGILTEITCPGNCEIRGVPEGERPAPSEGYGDVGEYLEASMDSWLWLAFYYDEVPAGLQEDTLQVWRFSEGWTLEGTSGHQLKASKNLVGANLTQSGIFAPLAQEENDVTPPSLSFVSPTPEDGSLIDHSHVVFYIASNENLSSASLELDGENHTMTGSGKEWSYETDVPDGSHTFRAYGQDLGGNNGTSEERSFEVDTEGPVYSNVGQDRDGIPRGGTVNVHAFWSDPHLMKAELYSNITGSWEKTDEAFFEGSEGWSNFSISMDEPGLYCWYIVAIDRAGNTNQTPVQCFEVYSPPEITSYSPESPVESYVGDSVTFTLTANQPVNVTWYVGESEVYRDENVLTSSYTNSTAQGGEYSVTAIIENENGSDSVSWTWYVYPKQGFTLSFTEPTPEDGAMLNVRSVVINVTSSRDLDNATLEWKGVNYTMTGSGKSWWAVKENLADGTYTFTVYGSADGVVNKTEERTVEIDATPPELLDVGQSSDEVIAGGNVDVFARWSDPHLGSTVLWSNTTFADGVFIWEKTPLEIVDGWSNWTINTNEDMAGKTFCWYIVANDTFGNENETERLCFRVEERLRIVSFSPEAEEITLFNNETATFSVTLNQVANVTWSINGSVVMQETGDSSTYTNSSLVPGLWNVSVTASNGKGEVSHWWLMGVEKLDTTPPSLDFLPPTPENGSIAASCVVTVAINASEELRSAVLELDGVNYTMSGEGRLWNYTTACLSDGSHVFKAYGTDYGGNRGATEERVVTVDTTDPEIVWVHANNLTLLGRYANGWVFRAERKANASFEFNVSDSNPAVWELYLNPKPGWVNLPIWSSPYQSGFPFGFAVPTREVGNNTYVVAIKDRAGNSVSLAYLVTVVDTTPPGTVENLSVEANSSGFTARWRNPYDEDFQVVELYLDPKPKEKEGGKEKKVEELDWEGAWIANVSGSPGEWMEFRWSTNPGRHVLYARTVDRYGNEGNLTEVNFTVPLPQFRLEFVKPTPDNGTVLDPGIVEVSIKVKSTTELRSCTLLVNGVSTTMEVSGKNCTAELTVIPGGAYNISVTGMDVYGRRNWTEARLFSEGGTCFGDASLTLNPPQNLEDLHLVIPFTLVTRSLPKFYWYRLEAGELSVTGKLQTDVYSVEAKTREDPFGRKETVYTVWGTFSIDLWEWRGYFGKYAEEGGIDGQLNVRLWDWCGNKLETSAKLIICKDAEEPKLQVQLKDFYYRGEEVILGTEGSENAKRLYYSVNGTWVEFNGTANLTGILRPGENTVEVKAVSPCGIERVETFGVFIGPPRNGDWVVNDTEDCLNHEFSFNGSLIVEKIGNLTLRGCKVHVLGEKVEVNGTLSALQNSLIEGSSLNLLGTGGELKVEDSELWGFGGGTFSGRASFTHSHLRGDFAFSSSTVSAENTDVEGGLTASGNLSVNGSVFHDGNGLEYTRPHWNSPGSLTIVNSTFRNNERGLSLTGTFADWSWTVENLLIENNRECGLYVEEPRLSYSERTLKNLTIRHNGIGACIRKSRLRFENSRVYSNGERNFDLDLNWEWLFLSNSAVNGSEYAFFSKDVGGIELWNTNVSGSISPYPTRIILHVEDGKNTTVTDGKAGNFYAYVDGELLIKSYTLENGKIEVRPGGTLRVEDADGVPATDPFDEDASVLKNLLIEGQAGEKESHVLILNTRLIESHVESYSKNTLLRGCQVNGGGLALNTLLHWERTKTESITRVIENDSNWLYSVNESPENWIYTLSGDGMSTGMEPFYANAYKSHFTTGTEVGQFTDLHLKKVVTLDKLPVQAWLNYYAISGVEIYVNGRKVVDKLDHEAQLSYSYGWGGGGITAHPLMGLVDIAGYLRPGENIIAVHVRSPNRYPYLDLGAFQATLDVVEGMAGLTDSVVNAPIYGSSARLILARDRVNGNITTESYSMVRVSDSTVHGGIKASGRFDLMRSNVTGNGSGTGISIRPPGGVLNVRESRISGFEYGINARGDLTVSWSEISENGAGIDVRGSHILINSSYIMDNGVGLSLNNVTGSVHNNVIYGNDLGISQVTGSDSIYSRGNRVLIDHNTLVGNGLGVRFEGSNGMGYVGFMNNIVEDNSLGLYFNTTLTPDVVNATLVNYRDVLVADGFMSRLYGIDWGGKEPKMVKDYDGGFMYTSSGEVQDDYDILSRPWVVVLWTDENASYDWGSDLLSAFLRVTPLENGRVKGVVTLEGSATSRDGISRVVYEVVQNNTVVLLNQSVSGYSYHDYVTLDSLSMNLTGEGILKFTAVDSRGRKLTSARRVYFSNAEIVIENVSVTNASNIYSLYRVEYLEYEGNRIPWEMWLNPERLANITVYLKNIGLANGTARIEIDLPEYIERHTGNVGEPIYLGPNESGVFHVSIPIVEYDVGTLSWDVQPDELPDLGRFTAVVRLYDEDNILRKEIPVRIGFTLGPVFKITAYNMYPYSRGFCESFPDLCHNSPPYDGDGDDEVEASENHHFDLYYKNVGDTDANVTMITVTDHISERWEGTKLYKGMNAYIFPEGPALIDAGNNVDLLGMAEVGEVRSGRYLYMDWWHDAPPAFIPPVNYSGHYMTSADFYYTVDGKEYYTPSLNYKESPVKALNKTFQVQHVHMNPIDVTVMAVKDGKTYLTLHNTNGNVYYDYYADGAYGVGEGYKWYHIIPPDFTMRAIADGSRDPNKVIPTYRIIVGAKPSLIGNDFRVVSRTIEGILDVLGISVPTDTIVMGLANAILKIVNLVETIDFQTESESFETINTSPRRDEVDNALLASNETVIAPIGIDTFARLEDNYGMDRTYYGELMNLDQISMEEGLKVLGKLVKAIFFDEDLQVLLIESIIEASDKSTYYNLAKLAKSVYTGDTAGTEGAVSSLGTAAVKKALKNQAKKLVLEEIKKTKYFRSLTKKQQKAYLKKAGGQVGALVSYTFDMAQFVTYVIMAPVPGSRMIFVLDPPANFTVKAEKADRALIFGGGKGNGTGIANVSLTFGEPDVYKARYTVLTPTTAIGPLFNGTLEWMRINVTGSRKGADVEGTTIIEMKPTAEAAKPLFAFFRDEENAKAFAGAYFEGLEDINVSIRENVITITATGRLNALPEDEEIRISMAIDGELLRANITRRGHYNESIEIKPAFGVSLNDTSVRVEGPNASVVASGNEVLIVRNERTPEINVSSTSVPVGGVVRITSTSPCLLSWRLDGRSGEGELVKTEGIEPGNHTLAVECAYGNGSVEKEFRLEVTRPKKPTPVDGLLVELRKGRFGIFEFSTDLYMLTFTADKDIKGVLGVYQRPGEVEGYHVYTLFNITHPENWSIRNVTLRFRVPKAWLRENNVSSNDVLLLRYSGGWTEFRTVFEYEDARYAYYRASVPGLSLFAVGEKIEASAPPSGNQTGETTTPSPTETPGAGTETSTGPGTSGGTNWPYYVLAGALLVLIVAYLYRRR